MNIPFLLPEEKLHTQCVLRGSCFKDSLITLIRFQGTGADRRRVSHMCLTYNVSSVFPVRGKRDKAANFDYFFIPNFRDSLVRILMYGRTASAGSILRIRVHGPG